jgi:hypothetical protein
MKSSMSTGVFLLTRIYIPEWLNILFNFKRSIFLDFKSNKYCDIFGDFEVNRNWEEKYMYTQECGVD